MQPRWVGTPDEEPVPVDNIFMFTSGGIYQFSGTVTFSQSSLLSDDNPGGPLALGTFAGGVTMTIFGNFKQFGGSPLLLADSLLLEATMDITQTDWQLGEDGDIANWVSTVGDTLHLNPTDGEWHDQLELGQDGLKIADFSAAYSFEGTQPTVTDFSTISYEYSDPAKVQIVAVPEPISLLFLGLGGLAVSTRTKRKLTK